MTDAILVLNAGSSSLKFSVFTSRAFKRLVHGQIEGIGGASHLLALDAAGKTLVEHNWPADAHIDHEQGLAFLLDALLPLMQGYHLVAVGHRIVHGGARFQAPVVLTPEVLVTLTALVPLAPLHQGHNLAPVHALQRLRPKLQQVGCFDTAFHTTNPDVAQRFALPFALHDAGVRRYGFHGLSYEYIASRLPAVDAHAAKGRTAVMHLGNGASMCALQAGVSQASSMGFTALDGLPMGTRCGALDAGVLLWLMDERGMGARQIEQLLYKESGLLGVSGLSADMRTLLASDSVHARQAVDLFVYRIARELGAMAACLGGLDAIVFTAGIGEHAGEVRARVCRDAAWLGVALDEAANSRPVQDGEALRISTPESSVSAWVIPTNEELMIARHVRELTPGG
jgi:acetate kinase